ncbi:hypothetical protein SAMD00019534_056590 [Acytostelium subglobosum LB1]|uniref:hypothetical protein n=1 Tax=Acytostelium subglobosum LB1 TaxID=1410327 RepID=UPI0006451585|nr:hypothetical protein SAMD00019534_056590 [Acytostelium subglobosum LB1]GAM22484.1 hypothetical protein SAMD00019534_056590 [Acytostelium subglobosum LB1]|eukprot:XP_012754604.1 hypothetical protein SAMD00019534_056590 [Acytostelium subglobosum LB1]
MESSKEEIQVRPMSKGLGGLKVSGGRRSVENVLPVEEERVIDPSLADDVDVNDDFGWLAKRTNKKVTSIIEQQQLQQQQRQQKDEQELENDKEEDGVVVDDELRLELEKVRKEWESDAPVDGSNLSFTTLVRAAGKLTNSQDIHNYIKNRLARYKGEIELEHCHQLMREFITRGNKVVVVEHLFNMLANTRDLTVERMNLEVSDPGLAATDDPDAIVVKLVRPTRETYNLLMESHSVDGAVDKCLALLDLMQAKYVVPDERTYLHVINAYTGNNRADEATGYLNHHIIKRGLIKSEDNLVAGINSIIYCYARAGNLERVDGMLKFMADHRLRPNHFTFQHMVEAHIKREDLSSAVRLLRQLDQADDIATTTYSLHQVIEALSRESLLEQRGDLVASRQWSPNINTYNVLVEACSRCNNVERAFEVFNELRQAGLEPSIEIYSSLEALSFKNGRIDLYNQVCGDTFHIKKRKNLEDELD